MPIPQDFLTKIVNVQWGKSIDSVAVGYFGSQNVRIYEPDGTLRWAANGPASMWEVCRDADGYAYSYGQLLYDVHTPPGGIPPNWNAIDPTYLWKFHKDTGAVMWQTQVTATIITVIFPDGPFPIVHRMGSEGGLATDPHGNVFISHLDADPASEGGLAENVNALWLIKKYSPSGSLIQTKVAWNRAVDGDNFKPDWGYFCDGDGNLFGGYIGSPGIFKRSPSLNLLWEFDPGGAGHSIPIVDESNNVYLMSGGTLYKLSPEGVLQWSTSLGDPPPVSYHQIGTDGTNVYAFTDGKIHKVESELGVIEWTMDAGYIDWSAGGYYCANYFSGPLYKFDNDTGALEWTVTHLGIDGGGAFSIAQVPRFAGHERDSDSL